MMLARRRVMGSKQEDVYKDMVTCEFQLKKDGILPVTHATTNLATLIIDEVEVENVVANMSWHFTSNETHKIGWKCVNVTHVPYQLIPNIREGKSDKDFVQITVNIPKCIISIEDHGMRGYPTQAPNRVNAYPATPPACSTIGIGLWYMSPAARRLIYVPAASVELYRSAPGWSQYASAIIGM